MIRGGGFNLRRYWSLANDSVFIRRLNSNIRTEGYDEKI